jgi:Tol biopolymer transport system component
MMVPFDQNSMTVTGEPTALIEGLRVGTAGATDLAVSSTGTLVYSIGAPLNEQYKKVLVWMTRDGKASSFDLDWAEGFSDPALSPDGKQLAITLYAGGGSSDIWIRQLTGGASIQLTHDRFSNGGAAWTPDGRSVTFFANGRNGTSDLLTQPSDGSGKAVVVFRGGKAFFAKWSPDGKWLTFALVETDEPESGDIVGIRPGIDTAPVSLVASTRLDGMQEVSPDGHWMVYGSDVTGRFQIYVVPFPNTKAGKWQITTLGGAWPKWSAHGNEIIYREGNDVMAVAVRTTPTFSFSKPRRLFVAKRSEFPHRDYTVSPDGQRILMVRRVGVAVVPDKLIVVENWFEELKKSRK